MLVDDVRTEHLRSHGSADHQVPEVEVREFQQDKNGVLAISEQRTLPAADHEPRRPILRADRPTVECERWALIDARVPQRECACTTLAIKGARVSRIPKRHDHRCVRRHVDQHRDAGSTTLLGARELSHPGPRWRDPGVVSKLGPRVAPYPARIDRRERIEGESNAILIQVGRTVALVADQITVGVALDRDGRRRAKIARIRDPVPVVVDLGAEQAAVARIVDTVVIAVALVPLGRAQVARITTPVAVCVALVGVRHLEAVVLTVRDAVAVLIRDRSHLLGLVEPEDLHTTGEHPYEHQRPHHAWIIDQPRLRYYELVRSVLLVSAVLMALSAAASADTTPAPWSVGVTDAKKAEANRLLERGNALFLEKKYSDALAAYRSAVAAWDHPAIRFNIVRCLIQLDRPVEAAENLETALRYGAAPLEDAVYTEAVAYDKLLKKQVATVSIACKQPGVTISLDGQQIATCPATTSRQLTPGRHQLLGTGEGLLAKATEVVLAGGDTQAVEVTLIPIPRASTTGVGARTLGRAALYGGGGLLAISGGLGLWAWRSYRAPFPQHCTESPDGGRPTCDPSGADRLDRARLIGNVATVTGAVGVAAAITGVIVLWRTPRAENPVTVTTSGTGVALGGTF